MSGLIAVENKIIDLVALVPAKIDIKVWRTLALGVEETLKRKVEGYGVDIGDAQAISNSGIGSRPPAYIVKIASAGVTADLVCNQEIARETQVFDNLELTLDAFGSHPVITPIAFGKTVHTVLMQQLLIIVAVAGKGCLVFDARKIKTKGTLPEDTIRIGEQLRQIRK
ncbi:hypothetical protein D3C71_1036740 [compost metagenome]